MYQDKTNLKLTHGEAEIGGVDDSPLQPADSLKNLVVEPLDPSTTLRERGELSENRVSVVEVPTMKDRGALSENPVSVVEAPQSCTADAANAASEYLEEECYPEEEMCADEGDRKLLLLTYLPEDNTTLESWLGEDNSLESCLSITSQVCQFSSTNQIDLKINPIPRIYQLLKIALSPLPEERFP